MSSSYTMTLNKESRSPSERWSLRHVSSEESDMEDSSPLAILEGCSGPYKDFLKMPVHRIKLQLTTPKSKRKGPRGGVTEPFPLKLYEMLCGVEQEGLTNIVSWRKHGRSFHIELPKVFVTEIMPRYFKQSKLTSFQRQLNLYGFEKVSSGRDRGTYYHPLFLRGRPDICKVMLRTRVKGGVGAVIYSSDSDGSQEKINFYSLPFCPPADHSQHIHRESARSSGASQFELSSEVSHSEGEVEATQNVELDQLENFQPIPFDVSSQDLTPFSPLWDSVGDFSTTPPAPDRIPEHDDLNESSALSYFDHPDQVYSTQYSQYTIMNENPFQPFENSHQATFEPPQTSCHPYRPIVDFAGRKFQCMDDDGIRAYERALKKRYIS